MIASFCQCFRFFFEIMQRRYIGFTMLMLGNDLPAQVGVPITRLPVQ